ncbi:MAG: hypothetical protein ACYDBP_06350 [Leptospirales bacterium]|jgi:hypothetical protein
MPSLTLKDIPDDLYRSLSDLAKSHRRSLSKELVVALETYALSAGIDDKERLIERIRKVRDRYSPAILDSDIEKWKDRGRL